MKKKEAKITCTFATHPSVKKKIASAARKERKTFSEKVHEVLSSYANIEPGGGFLNLFK